MTLGIRTLDAPSCIGGENPLWDSQHQVLYYIDNFGKRVHRHDPANGETTSWETPDIVTALALRHADGVVVTIGASVQVLHEDGTFEVLITASTDADYGFNDGKVDTHGRLLIGASTGNTAEPGPEGGLFRLDPDHTLTRLDEGIHYSNSPSWSLDERTFYFSDSWIRTIYAYDYDSETGEVSNRREFAETSTLGGVPDGAALDTEGNLWVAIYGSGSVVCFAPDGSAIRSVALPVSLVSSVTFGGTNLDLLYVTSVAHGVGGEEPEDGAGSVFVIDGLGARGVAEHRFAG